MAQIPVNLLTSTIDDQFKISEYFDFYGKISGYNFNLTTFMVGYDIQSLFNNIPVDETCNIISDKNFPQQDNIFQRIL